jgi:hypothetical protein
MPTLDELRAAKDEARKVLEIVLVRMLHLTEEMQKTGVTPIEWKNVKVGAAKAQAAFDEANAAYLHALDKWDRKE